MILYLLFSVFSSNPNVDFVFFPLLMPFIGSLSLIDAGNIDLCSINVNLGFLLFVILHVFCLSFCCPLHSFDRTIWHQRRALTRESRLTWGLVPSVATPSCFLLSLYWPSSWIGKNFSRAHPESYGGCYSGRWLRWGTASWKKLHFFGLSTPPLASRLLLNGANAGVDVSD